MTRCGWAIGVSLLAQIVLVQGAGAEAAVIVGPSSHLSTAQESARRESAARIPRSPCPDVAALLPGDARTLIARVAAEEGFFPDFVLSVAKIESRYVSTALSDKGAYGLMQLLPETARRFEVELCNPEGNVRGGIRLLRALHARYRNPLFILAAYNAGEDVVRKSRGVPPFPETVRFVADVLNDFYAWPDTADGSKAPAVLASAATPGIVELDPGKPATSAPVAATPPNSKAASPRWDSGFVMHVE